MDATRVVDELGCDPVADVRGGLDALGCEPAGRSFAGQLRLALADIRRAVGLIDGCDVSKGAGALLAALDALERAGGTVQGVMIELS